MTLALLSGMQLSGCVGAPVQEMSNARQAVRAAQQAGGAKYSPEAMAEAERLLQSARANQSKGEYRVAREEAEQARDKAMQARREAEAAKASKPGP
jgi:spore cortex formation protein SpoVR/YcgB (stage V sporulation)